MAKIQMIMSEENAKVIATACEFYARIKCGQFKELVWHLLDHGLPSSDYCKRRDDIEELLLKIREQIYPELHGWGHSYGIGKFEDADRAFAAYETIRVQFGDDRYPFSYYDMPKCRRLEETE